MSPSAYFVFILATSAILPIANSAKILFMAQMFAKSHFNVFHPIIEGLASRHHDITIHSFFPLKGNHSNVRWLQLTPPENPDFGNIIELEAEVSKSVLGSFRGWPLIFGEICKQILVHESTKTLLSEGKQYDLVVVDALGHECATVVASIVGKHTVLLFTSALFPWVTRSVPMPPSYVPNILAELPTKMDFCQRLENLYYYVGMSYITEYELLPSQQEVISKILPNAPKIREAEKQVVFFITNADPVMFGPRPTMPHVVDCGAMHCGKAKPLPKDLNDFVESSGNDGFILFGLGSGVSASMLKPEFIQAFISAFGKLKQKVIWKFDKPLENLPANVKTVDWMPQQDLLGHPKVRLFITHAGLLSLQETIYHGVPVVTIPLFAEQPGNAARVKDIGIGEPLNFLNVTADGVYKLVLKILNDKSYHENVKKYSAILKDQPEKPVNRAIFWIEYVLRHDGARHFRSAGEDLNFFQYFLLDVIAFVFVVLITIAGISFYLCKLVFKWLVARKGNRRRSEKKDN